ncbi:hypothetical protein DQ04_06511050 [Trypanosoma grayi]|uniref:hypothetical protein n=1 Tax=Trypanosoma grayi TaxID=71804 RepID=UPI0004F4B8DB|nr:hypothetical protein DQ04_06511050 [Trypanosoma grayi]KEG08751.1 hypothetical protein DQ04_06511050 [Trypanosoma grayi]
MPLKFPPCDGSNRRATPLAVVYTLRHENAVILQTYRSRRGGGDSGRRRRPLRALPSSTETAGQTAKERHVTTIPPLRLTELAYNSLSKVGKSAAPIPPAATETAGAVMEPLEGPRPCLPTERTAPPLLPLSLQHDELPLPLALALPRRQRWQRLRRAEWLLQALAGKAVAATWDEMLAKYRAAWVAAVQGATSELELSIPSHSQVLPLLTAGLLEAPCVSSYADSVAPCQFDSTVVPYREQRVRMRVQQLFLRLLIKPSPVDVAVVWNDPRHALHAQEGIAQRLFHDTTRLQDAAIVPPPSPSPRPSSVVVEGGDAHVDGAAADTHKCLELPSIVVPHLLRRRREEGTAEQRQLQRRSYGYCVGAQNALQQLSPVSLMPQSIAHAGELRFPEGRHVRQTLTLRNIAEEELQKVCGLCGLRRRSRRQRVAAWQRLGGSFAAAPCRDLAVAALFIPSVVLAAHCVEPPPTCRESGMKKRRCEENFQPPPLMMMMMMLPPLHSSCALASSSWLPLAVEAEDDGSCCSRADVTLCPLRVFSRESELQSFQALRQWGAKWPGEDGEKVETTASGDEKWYHAAFLHDVRTMALPYRETSAVVEDAQLHYCYRLALHRERQRLGLGTAP